MMPTSALLVMIGTVLVYVLVAGGIAIWFERRKQR